VSVSGCTQTSGTFGRAVIGTGAGAGAGMGYTIGGKRGAIVGGVIGGLAGGVLGNEAVAQREDSEHKQDSNVYHAQPSPNPSPKQNNSLEFETQKMEIEPQRIELEKARFDREKQRQESLL
jgi:hypothetical protein